MRTHIKVVALLNIVLGALGVLRTLVGVIGGAGGSIFSGSLVVAIVGTVSSVVFGLIFGAIALMTVCAGFGLLNGKSWARYTLIIASIFYLFNPWLCTIFGIYSLWVLFNRETQQMVGDTIDI